MEPDLENESSNAFNVRRSYQGTVRKRLFPTPAPVKSNKVARTLTDSPTSSHVSTSTIINQHSIAHHYPPVTPQPANRHTLSARKRPSVANIEGTPSVRKRIVCQNPHVWQARQASDLLAWLNHELLHPLDSQLGTHDASPSLPHHPISRDPVYLRQLSAMYRLFHSSVMVAPRSRLAAMLRNGSVAIDSQIDLCTNDEQRRNCISVLLLNYHPAWLLSALCVVFDSDFAIDLDIALRAARITDKDIDEQFTLMHFLEDVLFAAFLSPQQYLFTRLSPDTAAPSSPLPPALTRRNFHRLVLQRFLDIVFLLDCAKTRSKIYVKADPPLFRHDATVSSSEGIVSLFGKKFMVSSDLRSFLRKNEFTLVYRSPSCEVNRSYIASDLTSDLRDGIRLCKLAALFTNDRELMYKVEVPSRHQLQQDIQKIRVFNVHLAMRTLLKFASRVTKESVQWYAVPGDIVDGVLPNVLSFLWQLVALWRDTRLINTSDLSAELAVVREVFRNTKREVSRLSQSPSADTSLREVSPSIQSPSNLIIYEKCDDVNSSLLLEWSAVVCGTFGLAIRDFAESFRDGAALCLMLEYYYPDLFKGDEVVRVTAAELRQADDAEIEFDCAQKNFKLFENRLRILGNLPQTKIDVDLALSPNFSSTHKQDSFGRLVNMLLSYLFSCIVSQKGVEQSRAQITQLIEETRKNTIRDQAAKIIAKALSHLHVLGRLERMGGNGRSMDGSLRTTGRNRNNVPASMSPRRTAPMVSPSRPPRMSPSKPPRMSPSKPPRMSPLRPSNASPGRTTMLTSSKSPMRSPGKPPKLDWGRFSDGLSMRISPSGQAPYSNLSSLRDSPPKIPSFLSSTQDKNSPFKRKSPSHSASTTLSLSSRASPSKNIVADSEESPLEAVRRRNAANTIASYCKAWKARRKLDDMKGKIELLQTVGRAYLARLTVADIKKNTELVDSYDVQENERTVDRVPTDAEMERLLAPAKESFKLTSDVLPRVLQHLAALDGYEKRMLAYEKEQSETLQDKVEIQKETLQLEAPPQPSKEIEHQQHTDPQASSSCETTAPAPPEEEPSRPLAQAQSKAPIRAPPLPLDVQHVPTTATLARTQGQVPLQPLLKDQSETSAQPSHHQNVPQHLSHMAAVQPIAGVHLSHIPQLEEQGKWSRLAYSAAVGGGRLLGRAIMSIAGQVTSGMHGSLTAGEIAMNEANRLNIIEQASRQQSVRGNAGGSALAGEDSRSRRIAVPNLPANDTVQSAACHVEDKKRRLSSLLNFAEEKYWEELHDADERNEEAMVRKVLIEEELRQIQQEEAEGVKRSATDTAVTNRSIRFTNLKYDLAMRQLKEMSTMDDCAVSCDEDITCNDSAVIVDDPDFTSATLESAKRLEEVKLARFGELLESAEDGFRETYLATREHAIHVWISGRSAAVELKTLADEEKLQETSLYDEVRVLSDRTDEMACKYDTDSHELEQICSIPSIADIDDDVVPYEDSVTALEDPAFCNALQENTKMSQDLMVARLCEVLEAAEEGFTTSQQDSRERAVHLWVSRRAASTELKALQEEEKCNALSLSNDIRILSNFAEEVKSRYYSSLDELYATRSEDQSVPEIARDVMISEDAAPTYDVFQSASLDSIQIEKEITLARLGDVLDAAEEGFYEAQDAMRQQALLTWLRQRSNCIKIKELEEEDRDDTISLRNEIWNISRRDMELETKYNTALDELEEMRYNVTFVPIDEGNVLCDGSASSLEDCAFDSAFWESTKRYEQLTRLRLGEVLQAAEEGYLESQNALREHAVHIWVCRRLATSNLKALEEERKCNDATWTSEDRALSDHEEGVKSKYNAILDELAVLSLSASSKRVDEDDVSSATGHIKPESEHGSDTYIYDILEDDEVYMNALAKESELMFKQLGATRFAEAVEAEEDEEEEEEELQIEDASDVVKQSVQYGDEIAPGNISDEKARQRDSSPDVSCDLQKEVPPEGSQFATNPFSTPFVSSSYFRPQQNVSTPEEDFVSLSSFEGSHASSRPSANFDFASLSSYDTGHLPYLRDNHVHTVQSDTPPSHALPSARSGITAGQLSQGIGHESETERVALRPDFMSPGMAMWPLRGTPSQDPQFILGRLSAEIEELGREMSPNVAQSLTKDDGTSQRIQGLMRRLSVATSSPINVEVASANAVNGTMDSTIGEVREEEQAMVPVTEVRSTQTSFASIARMILVVLRLCKRSEQHIALVQLGMKIIHDLCTVQQRLTDVMDVEESVDVISTCIQFYRDDEAIFCNGVEVMRLFSEDVRGKHLLQRNIGVMSRLKKVCDIMSNHLDREQRNKKRVKHSRLVISTLLKRKENPTRGLKLADELRKMSEVQAAEADAVSNSLDKLAAIIEQNQRE